MVFDKLKEYLPHNSIDEDEITENTDIAATLEQIRLMLSR